MSNDKISVREEVRVEKINLLVSNHSNRKLLKELLHNKFQVVAKENTNFSGYSLIMLDKEYFGRYKEQIKKYKQNNRSFTPMIFLQKEGGNSSQNLFELVEDIIKLPISKKLLLARVKNLIRNQRLWAEHKMLKDRYENMFNSINDMVFLLDIIEKKESKFFRIVETNKKLRDKLDYNQEAFKNFSLRKFMPKEDVNELLRLLTSQGEALLTTEFYPFQGDPIPVEINARKFNIHNKEQIICAARDITEKKRRKEVEKVRNLLKNLVNQAPGVTFQYQLFPDGSSAFPYASEGIEEIYEISPEEVKDDASKVLQRIHPDDYERVVNSIQKSAKNLTHWQMEYRVVLPERGVRWVKGNASPEKLSDGSVLWHGNINDITERKNKEKELEEVSLYDSDSGLPNSSNLIREVDVLMEEGKRGDIHLILLDVENHEEIMNAIGHARWGEFLREVAMQLKERQEINFTLNNKEDRNKDIEIKVYNIYRNKLGFLLVNVSEDSLSDFVHTIKSNAELPFYYNKIPVFLNSYLGVVSYKEEDSGADLLQNAYQVMSSAAKEKKKVKFYKEAIKDETRENFQLLGEIQNGLVEDQFELHYMPKVKLSSGEIVGVEALIRWLHPEEGIISPGRFIPHVEATGLINELSRWVVNETAEERLLLAEAGIDVSMAVNISPNNLKQEDFVQEVKDIIAEKNLSPDQFELELTETEIMEELTTGNNTLNMLMEEGFKIAMDDFGTGYSSLAYLKNLDIDSIKIDLSFIQAMQEDKKSYEIVKTAIRLGKILNKEVVAEGIESENVMLELNKLGCDYGQGFYICKPVPREEFVKFYKKWQE